MDHHLIVASSASIVHPGYVDFHPRAAFEIPTFPQPVKMPHGSDAPPLPQQAHVPWDHGMPYIGLAGINATPCHAFLGGGGGGGMF